MADKKGNESKQKYQLTQEECAKLEKIIFDFISGDQEKLSLPGLSSEERMFVHNNAVASKLRSVSTGRKKERIIHIIKCKRKLGNKLSKNFDTFPVLLTNENIQLLNKINMDIDTPNLTNGVRDEELERKLYEGTNILSAPQVVPPPVQFVSSAIIAEQQALPVAKHKERLLKLLESNSVVIINGETGSGKSTQVPQYLLSEARRTNTPCRIVVTQPRRVAAISVASRVAEERGEVLGHTVGYQIRLGSKGTKKTCLYYTTGGWFLRVMMSKCEELFKNISYLIIDEIHERDKDTDFTLIIIKQQLKINKNLKIILMSATMDLATLAAYFENCPLIRIPGRSYDVKIYHLEDILLNTDCYADEFRIKFANTEYPELLAAYEKIKTKEKNNSSDTTDNIARGTLLTDDAEQKIIDNLIESMDQLDQNNISAVAEYFDQLMYYIESEGVHVDVSHRTSGLTPLMMASKYNLSEQTEHLIKLGAQIEIRDSNNKTAYNYAVSYGHTQCMRVLDMKEHYDGENIIKALQSYQKKAYNEISNDIDHHLIVTLITNLIQNSPFGSILVFLPGINEIITQKNYIEAFLDNRVYEVIIMHGQVESGQYRALNISTCSRKIILSTNISQTSLTIPDLVYVIDAGRIKTKVFDANSNTSKLELAWISKADAQQRSGRVGRTQNGTVYRLYYSTTYLEMLDYGIPEFSRISLFDICLYAKALKKDVKIKDFLAQALTPPKELNIKLSIKFLQIVEALNNNENLTPLGMCLVELPLDVQLGRMLLYGIFLGCYQSMLTIVAYKSVKEPFNLNTDYAIRMERHKKFSGLGDSDHVAMINLYNAYKIVRHNEFRCRIFCEKYNLSMKSMELFIATRKHIHDVVSRLFELPRHQMCNELSSHNACEHINKLKLAILAGLYPNLVHWDSKSKALSDDGNNKHQLIIGRDSVFDVSKLKNYDDQNHETDKSWVVYQNKAHIVANKFALTTNTIVTSLMVTLIYGRNFTIESCSAPTDGIVPIDDDREMEEKLSKLIITEQELVNGEKEQNALSSDIEKNGSAIIHIDKWIKFICDKNLAEQIQVLRNLFKIHFQEFIVKRKVSNNATSVINIFDKLVNNRI